MNRIRIGFFGDGPWAHDTFSKIIRDPQIEIKFVCTRSDIPDDILLNLAKLRNIPAHIFPNINSKETLKIIENYRADLLVSMSFNQIFKPEILNTPPLGVINCHAGKLPFYRGRNVINWALINGEREFGITVHRVDTGIDTGDIILQETFPIGDKDDYGDVLQIAYYECAPLIIEAIHQLMNGTANFTPQKTIDLAGTYFPKRKPGDEIINWNLPTRQIFNFIRALAYPGPFAQTYLGAHRYSIQKAQLFENAPIFKSTPGTVVGIEQGKLIVKTQESVISIIKYEGNYEPHLGDRFE